MNDLFTVATEFKAIGVPEMEKAMSSYLGNIKKVEEVEKTSSKSSDQLAKSKDRLEKSTKKANDAQQRARQQLLATANSIAVLDGPLGGVASRFSAFGVLIGRIGIPLASFGLALSTFTFTAQKAIREFAEWEKSISTIENRLNSVGNQFNLTTQEIINFSENLALTTLANEREVLNAANSLLTFRNITTDLFGDILTAAQDLAASGFGTIESETLRLAKALEDPRQGLTSLSRAGITFTRQQREVIISLVDTGREAEALGLVLSNVERQVGGAGLAQASNTLAGSFDTIGQGVRTLTRDLGEFITESLGFRFVVNAIADSFSSRLTERARTASQVLTELTSSSSGAARELSELREIARRFELDVRDVGWAFGPTQAAQETLDYQQRIVEALRNQVELATQQRDVQQAESSLQRRQESLDNLEEQINLQRTLIGLTEEQQRVQRAMAAEGFAGDVWANINTQVEAYAASLQRAGVETGMITRLTNDMRNSLQGARDVAERYAEVFRQQAIAREINRIEESTESANEVMRVQLRILQDARDAGDELVTVTEARRRADMEIRIQMIETQRQLEIVNGLTAILAGNFEEAARAAREVARMAALIKSIEEGIQLQTDIAGFSRNGRGGGGGRDPNEDYRRELDALVGYLDRRREEMMIAAGFERNLIMEQYDERFQTLQNALDRKLITEQDYSDRLAQLVQSREDRIAQIERAAAQARLGLIAGIFGDMASAAQAGGEKMIKVQAALAYTQGMINAYLAYTQAMVDPTLPILTKIAFAAKVFSLTAAAAAQIKGGGAKSMGGGAGRTAAAPREPRELTPQRVIVEGLDPSALYSGEQLQNLFEAFYNENDNRGKVFVVNR